MRIPDLTSVFVLCGLLLTPVLAASQTAASGKASSKPDGFNTDARLKQSVAVHAEGVPVGELLDLLSRKTGVSLKAEMFVADDKVVAFSPARPLRATLVDLAALFNDSWEEAPLANGKMRYTLVRRFPARRYEDDLEQQVVVRARALLEAQVKALDETEPEFAKRPAGDRIRQNLEARLLHGRQATRLYAQLSPAQKDALFTDGFLNVSFASSTPPQQAMAREAFDEVRKTLKQLDDAQRVNFPDVHIVIDPPERLERHGLRFRLTHTNNAGLSGEVLQVILGANSYMTMGSFESRDQWLVSAHGNPYVPREKLDTAGLPASKAIEEAGKNLGWIDRLSALAASERVPLFSDYYRSPALLHELSPPASRAETPVPAEVGALDTLCRPSGFAWWKRGGTLLMRKRDWYAQRRYEVPDKWLRGMALRLQKQKSLPTYGDLYQLLDLTARQISGLNAVLSSVTPNGEDALVDLDNQEGLHEMLRLIQAGKAEALPLPMGIPNQIFSNGNEGPPPVLVPLITRFLNTLRLAAIPDNLRDFSILLYGYTPDMLKAAQAVPPENLPIHIDWKLGADNDVLNASAQYWSLWLPLKVPYDRSDKTRIDIMDTP
jgi:hypothetical protein